MARSQFVRGDEIMRVKHGGGEPLRTFTEMCEEFGVDRMRLVRLLGAHGGPAPKVNRSNRSICANSWYSPREMRKWWSALPERIRHG